MLGNGILILIIIIMFKALSFVPVGEKIIIGLIIKVCIVPCR